MQAVVAPEAAHRIHDRMGPEGPHSDPYNQMEEGVAGIVLFQPMAVAVPVYHRSIRDHGQRAGEAQDTPGSP